MADQPNAFTGIWEAPVVDPSNEFRMTDPWYEAIQRTSARANAGVQGSGTPGGLAKWDTATSLTSAALSGDASTPTNSTVVTLSASGVVAGTYGDGTHVSQVTVDAKGRVTTAADVAITFPPDTGITQLTGDVDAGPGSGSQVATIQPNAVTTAKIANSNVTLAKIANAAADSVLLGSGAAGSGSPYVEIALGTNLSMSGTTLNASSGVTLDYVIASDGATPTPNPLDDGFGNFIYLPYAA